MIRCRDEQVGICMAAGVIAALSLVAAIFVGASCIDNIDVKVGLNEEGTYLAKSVTYDGNKVGLDFQEIDVATNKSIGPEFFHKRNAEPTDIKAGDIMIYQDGDLRHWVFPF